jgi:glycosyltransferase 2 family protein
MDTISIPRRLRSAIALLERVIPWLALLAAAVGLTLLLRSQREAVAAIDWTLPWRAVAISALGFAVAPLLQGLSFWLALRMLNATAPLGDTMVVWARSYVVRYAPTGALAIAYRVAARNRLGASAEQVLAAYGYEHVATLAAGAAVCLLLFAAVGGLPPWPALVVAVVALALTAAVRPGALGRALSAMGRRLGVHVSALLSPGRLVALVALNALGWLATGAGVLVVVTSATGDTPGFVWLVSAYTAGYLVGFVAPLAPGGLGVREGMLVMLLRSAYGVAPAAGISVAIRVVNVAGELVAVGLVHGAYGIVLAARRLREAIAPEPEAA